MPTPKSKAPAAKKKKGAQRRRPGSHTVKRGPTALPAALQQLPAAVQHTLAQCTPNERAFVMKYAGPARGNATLAAQMAKLGTSYATQASLGSTLLQRPHVRAAIDAWMQAFALSAAQVTAGFADLAQANMGPFLDWDPASKQLTVKVPDAETWEAHKHWVKSVRADAETGRVTHIELHDALAARRDLAKIMKLYSDAPILNVHLHLQQMSDEELLRELHQAEQEVRGEAVVRPAVAEDNAA